MVKYMYKIGFFSLLFLSQVSAMEPEEDIGRRSPPLFGWTEDTVESTSSPQLFGLTEELPSETNTSPEITAPQPLKSLGIERKTLEPEKFASYKKPTSPRQPRKPKQQEKDSLVEESTKYTGKSDSYRNPNSTVPHSVRNIFPFVKMIPPNVKPELRSKTEVRPPVTQKKSTQDSKNNPPPPSNEKHKEEEYD